MEMLANSWNVLFQMFIYLSVFFMVESFQMKIHAPFELQKSKTVSSS